MPCLGAKWLDFTAWQKDKDDKCQIQQQNCLKQFGLLKKFGSIELILHLHFTGYNRRTKINSDTASNSTSSKISTDSMMGIIERLKIRRVRESTYKNYYSIWRAFNKFIIRLDRMPQIWEGRVSLYCAQSATIKSYVSAIKHILQDDGYAWDNQKILLEAITRLCRLMNDKVVTGLPISENLLELLLFEVKRIFETQPYLDLVYKTIMSIGYHRLLRIGELAVTNGGGCGTQSHAIKACNAHVVDNKEKILLVLYTSKTHGFKSRPQKICITSNSNSQLTHNF